MNNVDMNDFIIKGKNNQRFYRAKCSSCQKDRGYIELRYCNKVCMSCTKTKHSKNISNVNFNDFIKEKSKPTRYRMTCNACGKDKGYKPIAYYNRLCMDCGYLQISKKKTKLSKEHKKLRHAFSVCISERLNKRGSSKSGNSIFTILGYSFDDLIIHLESQFEPWMNWDNYGLADSKRKTWQIDHIIPDSSFSYSSFNDEDFKKSWSLSNLRPYEAIANIIKSDKIEPQSSSSSEAEISTPSLEILAPRL